MPSVAKFLRQYLRPREGEITTESVTYMRGDEALPAVVLRPRDAGSKPLPGWVILHGLTYHGIQHPALLKFSSAVAASGSVVFIPEIPEWKRLRVAPTITQETIAAACVALHAQRGVNHERTGLIGFSFGATQALITAAVPEVQKTIRGIAAWGGYQDVPRLFRFGITGEHEIDGVAYRIEPDPYGGWIMGANYLRGIPGHEDDAELADALLKLAYASGQAGAFAWDSMFDPLKAELRQTIPARSLELYDLLARPTGVPVPDMERARELARELANAALRADPLLDPSAYLSRVGVRTLVAHGRDDRLVPFSESIRLHRALPDNVRAGLMITSLFAHSGGTQPELGRAGVALEGVRFVRLLKTILDLA